MRSRPPRLRPRRTASPSPSPNPHQSAPAENTASNDRLNLHEPRALSLPYRLRLGPGVRRRREAVVDFDLRILKSLGNIHPVGLLAERDQRLLQLHPGAPGSFLKKFEGLPSAFGNACYCEPREARTCASMGRSARSAKTSSVVGLETTAANEDPASQQIRAERQWIRILAEMWG